jgi:hypothetical protein
LAGAPAVVAFWADSLCVLGQREQVAIELPPDDRPFRNACASLGSSPAIGSYFGLEFKLVVVG